jgi:hypothetical protein
MTLNASFIPIAFTSNLNISGQGFVHLTETGFVVEGIFSRFYLPLGASIFRELVGVWSLRTIPYLMIESHKRVRFGKYLQVRYRLPGGKRTIVSFQIRGKKRKEQTKDLENKLQEHRSTIRALTGGLQS